MRNIRLTRRFNAAVCMFGAFGYLLSDQDVLSTLNSLGRTLGPKGLFVFEFWNILGVNPGMQQWITRKTEDMELIRLATSNFDAERSRLGIRFHFIM